MLSKTHYLRLLSPDRSGNPRSLVLDETKRLKRIAGAILTEKHIVTASNNPWFIFLYLLELIIKINFKNVGNCSVSVIVKVLFTVLKLF